MNNYTLMAMIYTSSLALVCISGIVQRGKYLLKAIGYLSLAILIYLMHNAYSLIDPFSSILGLATLALGFWISFYSDKYSLMESYGKGLTIYIDLYIFSLTTAFISPNLVLFATSWALAEIISYILIRIGEEHSIDGTLRASRGFLFTTTLFFEFSVFTLLIISISVFASLISLNNIWMPFVKLVENPISITPVLLPILMTGFLTKIATVPFHFWLPSAHAVAPAPASALLSGVSTVLGFYGLYRLLGIIDVSLYRYFISLALSVMGFLTVVYAYISIINQRDGKKLLAYSTIATNGFILIVFSMYLLEPGTLSTAVFMLGILMHMAYKTTLFSDMGLIEVSTGTRYIYGLGGLGKYFTKSLPGTYLALFTLLGVPGTIGFMSKALSIYVSLTQLLSSHRAELFLTIAGISAYVIISSIIALKYMSIYMPSTKMIYPGIVRTPPLDMQFAILILGLANVLFQVFMIAFSFPWTLLFISSILSPIAVLFALTPRLLIFIEKAKIHGAH
ncbi:MAG: proton-conducting transporter membrane subunit [Desulfurococcaceae archaeon]